MGEGLELLPWRDVAGEEQGFVALSREPWLLLKAPEILAAADRFVEIAYRASRWDEPVRPIFRFETADGGGLERIAGGPVAGAGLWTGRVPAKTVRVLVSPTTRPGRFDFRIERVRRSSWLALVGRGSRLNRRAARSAVLTRLIGWTPESDVNLAWAIGATPFAHYRSWRHARSRAPDLAALDRPRFVWEQAVPIDVYIDARAGAAGLEGTLDSLTRQIFPRWRAIVRLAGVLPASKDPRVVDGSALAGSPEPGRLIAALAPGDRLKPDALAHVAEAANRLGQGVLFYGDEEIVTPQGCMPVFKPGWSLLLHQQRPFLGRGVILRVPQGWSSSEQEAFVTSATLSEARLEQIDDKAVVPLRRVILETAAPVAAAPRALGPASPPRTSIAIVIPTRDQPVRLAKAIASIRLNPGTNPPHVVVVDNGSVEPETKRLLLDLRSQGVADVIDRPGPFNFSAMCNEGAKAARGDVLVFLNDDTEVVSEDWLDRLAAWASRAEIGAVGAKLTYPDARVQHVGVVLGLGESAGHFGAFATAEAPGWAGRSAAAHPVSAVTGACLAVARYKFDAVGGFDAVNLPVELNDIDLCLRLADQGWTTLVDPAVHLVHEESASRGGATFRRLDVYQAQRAYFKERWRHKIRDDPFFHPGLSLFHWDAALS